MFGAIMATISFAAVPWALAQLTILWSPQLQRSPTKRWQFRAVTAAGATVLTIPSMLPGAGPWFWGLAVIGATALDVHWRRYSRTRAGQRHLADAKQYRKDQREARAEAATRKATP
jgi:hypothetical protein